MKRPGPRHALLLALLVGAVVLRWYDLHPLVWAPDGPAHSGSALLHPVPADLLLLVDPAAIQHAASRSRSFAQTDWSYGWYNLAAQELGWVAVQDAAAWTAATCAGRRAVIVTRSARDAARTHLPELQQFVSAGGLLLLEQPDDGWQPLSGVRRAGPPRLAGALSGPMLDEELPELALMPMPTELVPLDCAAAGVELLFSSGGRPAACLRPLGRGAVIALGLDAGRLITALQQGTPAPGGFAVANRYPEVLSPHLESNDLVADPSLLDNPVPFADLFEGLLATLLERGAGPLPRWWGFPDAATGAYLATHDEEGMGDRAAWMAEAEHRWGARSTWFVMPGPGLGPAAQQAVLRVGAIGLHRNKRRAPDDASVELLGLGPIRPLARVRPLAEQAAWLAGLTGQQPLLNRNHFLLWDAGWAQPFREMAAAGVVLDSTYGPDLRCRGYLFATGRPFLSLDEQGLPLGVWELPFQLAEDLGGADRAYLGRLLDESSALYHTAVVSLFHPNAFLWHPSAEVFLTYRDAFAAARARGLWVADVAALQGFEQARRASSLRSHFAAGVLHVQVEAAADGLTVSVPRRWAGQRLSLASLDGQPRQPVLRDGRGGERGLLVVPPGEHRLNFYYRPEITAPVDVEPAR